MKSNTLILMLLLAGSMLACKSVPQSANRNSEPVTHEIWDDLLQKHVSDAGFVDYKGFIQDSADLRRYLDQLIAHPPNKKNWTKNERKAYWINAYNAFTVDIVARHYPVESIKDIGPAVALPFVNTVWDIKFIEIGGEKLDLNNVEHKKLRKQFDDERVHFAIVCASASCPILLNRAYVAERLDEQLDQQARVFLKDEFRNEVASEKLHLSKIFSWYKGDFTKKTNLIGFLQPYTDVKISPDAEIDFKDYDWSLNDQK